MENWIIRYVIANGADGAVSPLNHNPRLRNSIKVTVSTLGIDQRRRDCFPQLQDFRLVVRWWEDLDPRRGSVKTTYVNRSALTGVLIAICRVARSESA